MIIIKVIIILMGSFIEIIEGKKTKIRTRFKLRHELKERETGVKHQMESKNHEDDGGERRRKRTK